jgi:hypothetical protein
MIDLPTTCSCNLAPEAVDSQAADFIHRHPQLGAPCPLDIIPIDVKSHRIPAQ